MPLSPLTRQDAVNIALRAIGAPTMVFPANPWTPPASGATEDEQAALDFFVESFRLFALRRDWMYIINGNVNREDVFAEIAPGVGGRVVLPAGTVRAVLHPKDVRWGKEEVSERFDPSPGGGVFLWNNTKQTDSFDAPVRLQITYVDDFQNLPEAAKLWIAMETKVKLVGRRFSESTLLQDAIRERSEIERVLTMDQARRRRRTCFDNYSAARPLLRNQPILSPDSHSSFRP